MIFMIYGVSADMTGEHCSGFGAACPPRTRVAHGAAPLFW